MKSQEKRRPEALVTWALVPGMALVVGAILLSAFASGDPQGSSIVNVHTFPLLFALGGFSILGSWIWVGAVILKAAFEKPRWQLIFDLRVPFGVLSVLVIFQIGLARLFK